MGARLLQLQLQQLEFRLQQLWLLRQFFWRLLQSLLQLPLVLLCSTGVSVLLCQFTNIQRLLGMLLSKPGGKSLQQADFNRWAFVEIETGSPAFFTKPGFSIATTLSTTLHNTCKVKEETCAILLVFSS